MLKNAQGTRDPFQERKKQMTTGDVSYVSLQRERSRQCEQGCRVACEKWRLCKSAGKLIDQWLWAEQRRIAATRAQALLGNV